MKKITPPSLRSLQKYADKHEHQPASQAISCLIGYLQQGEITKQDLPVHRLFAEIENFQRGTINQNDLLINFLWILKNYGEAIKHVNLSKKLEELSQQLELKDAELKQLLAIPVIDFTEIPPANTGAGNQDTFELFARDFLHVIGYFIEEGPSRGPDRGKDLLVLESLSGVFSKAQRRWLVSCKHLAHSGTAVGINDEENIIDRLRDFKCDGFMAFYSTLPSTPLSERLMKFKSEGKAAIEVLDWERIAGLLSGDERLQKIVVRYFPESYKNKRRWEIELADVDRI